MKILLLPLLLFAVSSFSQTYTPAQFDSITFLVLEQTNKEMSTSENEIKTDTLLSRILNKEESDFVSKKFSNEKMYSNNRALLTHHNIVLRWYIRGKWNFELKLSTISGVIIFSDQGNINAQGLTKKGIKEVKKILRYLSVDHLIEENDYFRTF